MHNHNPLTSLQFTGDGAGRDHEGFYWIRGRVDDVVNVSGHRLSTAEIEAALIEHSAIAEAAVVGVADELTGQAVNAFVALKDGNEATDALRKEFILQVRKSIGPFAAPKAVYIVSDLPKTRSGKIMRRILRKILAGEEDQLGDISTVCFFPGRGVVFGVFANGGGWCSCLIRGLWTRLLLLFMMPRSKKRVNREKRGGFIRGGPAAGLGWSGFNMGVSKIVGRASNNDLGRRRKRASLAWGRRDGGYTMMLCCCCWMCVFLYRTRRRAWGSGHICFLVLVLVIE